LRHILKKGAQVKESTIIYLSDYARILAQTGETDDAATLLQFVLQQRQASKNEQKANAGIGRLRILPDSRPRV
jgi:hypothetical protein